MSHCKGPYPDRPGFYWARVHANWTIVEVREDGHVWAIGWRGQIMRKRDEYGPVESWGPRVKRPDRLPGPGPVEEH